MVNPPIINARQPRGMVKVNGEVMPGWVDWEVENNSFYQADTFRVTFAAANLPLDRNLGWWASQPAIAIEVLVGFPADPDSYTSTELDSLIFGQVDDLSFDAGNNQIEVSGRDLTAQLIDAKTTEKFQNQTSSAIATTLAKRHNLTPVVTATSKLAGTYYQIERAHLTGQMSEWDMLTWLAQQEAFSVYVKGQQLHFEPQTALTADPYVLQWTPSDNNNGSPTFNGMSLTFSRNLTLAKDVIVKVHSWNAKNMKGFTQTAKATHNKSTVLSGAAQPLGDAQTYSFNIPGLTPEQALQKAQSLLQSITQHEMRLNATLPGDNVLSLTNIVSVQGTGASFDQLYFPDSIVRSMNYGEGYAMTVSAKNHSPESQVTL